MIASVTNQSGETTVLQLTWRYSKCTRSPDDAFHTCRRFNLHRTMRFCRVSAAFLNDEEANEHAKRITRARQRTIRECEALPSMLATTLSECDVLHTVSVNGGEPRETAESLNHYRTPLARSRCNAKRSDGTRDIYFHARSTLININAAERIRRCEQPIVLT